MIYRGAIPFPVSLYSHLTHHLRSSPFAFSTFTFSVSFLCSCSSYFSCFTARNVHYNVLLNLQSSLASASRFRLGFLYCKESTGLFHLICQISPIYLSSGSGRRRCCGKTVWKHLEVAYRCYMYPAIGCKIRLRHLCGHCQGSVVSESRRNGCTPF